MVSILPSHRTPGDLISADVGRALQDVLPGAVQRGFEKGQGLNAIDQLQSDIASANGDISKMIPAIAKAYTMNPSLQRSGIAEKLIPLAQRNQGTAEFPAGGRQDIPMRQGREQEGEQQQVPVSVSDLVPARPSMVQNPQGLNDFQLPYGPEDIANIRQQARQKGYLPEMEERFVNDAMEYNKIAEQKRTADLNNYQQQQQQRRDTLENQNAFNTYMKNNAAELWQNPDDREMAIQSASRILEDPKTRNRSFTDVLADVKNELRPYQAAKKVLEKVLKRPLTGMTKEQRDLARPRAQMMVDMGQKPQLQLMIANGGNGEVEEADLLNPLPENIERHLSSMPKFVNPLEKVNVLPDSPEYGKQLARASETRLKQRENAIDYLSNEIKPGKDYSHPGTNILLSRYHLMEKGASWEEAGQIIDQAIQKGKIKLDPQQKVDFQRLGVPPLTGETYFDTVMNNVMFPITGRQ